MISVKNYCVYRKQKICDFSERFEDETTNESNFWLIIFDVL